MVARQLKTGYMVAAGHSMLAVRTRKLADAGASATGPATGTIVDVTVDTDDDVLDQEEVEEQGHAQRLELEGTLSAITFATATDPGELVLTVGKSTIDVVVPAGTALPATLAVGDKVEVKVTLAGDTSPPPRGGQRPGRRRRRPPRRRHHGGHHHGGGGGAAFDTPRAGRPGQGGLRSTAELFEAHAARVLGICRGMLRNSHDAEDAAQQAFLSAYMSLAAGTPPREPAAWLATIARNEYRTRAQRACASHCPARISRSPRAAIRRIRPSAPKRSSRCGMRSRGCRGSSGTRFCGSSPGLYDELPTSWASRGRG